MDSLFPYLHFLEAYKIDPLLHDVVTKYRSSSHEVNHMDLVLYVAVTKDDIDVLKEREMKMEGQLPVDEQRTATNSTVLHLACQYGSIKCVQHILIAHNSLLLIINTNLETALHLAAREGYSEVAAALLNAAKSLVLNPESYKYLDTSLTAKENFIRIGEAIDSTAMHVAVRHNQKNIVQLLLKECPQFSYPHWDCIYKHGGTPLYLASNRGYSDIIRTIFENSDSPAFDGPNGRTALHGALLDDGGHECAKLLLERNRDLIKTADDYGWTAFHYMAYNDLDMIVEDLVLAGKSVGYQADKYHSKTPLHIAAYQGNVRVMKKLMEYYPDSWEVVDGHKKNILHIAVEQEHKEVIKFILSYGRKATNNLLIRMDQEGNTPLHLIAKLGCYVQEFMDSKAPDWEVPNSKGLTPRDLLDSEQTGTLSADQTKIRIALTKAKPKRQYLRLQEVQMQAVKMEDAKRRQRKEMEVVERRQREKLKRELFVERTEKAINTHIIVAALITTVALTAGFAMPGGFDSTEGENQGSAMLLKKAAFQTFIITDAFALLLSISSLFLYFFTILLRYKDGNHDEFTAKLFSASTMLNLLSIMAMMAAFMTGTYAVLAHSLALAISVCIISSSFCLFLFYVFLKFVDSTFHKFIVGGPRDEIL